MVLGPLALLAFDHPGGSRHQRVHGGGAVDQLTVLRGFADEKLTSGYNRSVSLNIAAA
jgi:hypothetical protein